MDLLSDPLASSPTRRHAVEKVRTVDLFRVEKRKTAGVEASTHSNGSKLRQWSKSAVEASSTLQASLQEHSKLRRKVHEATLRSKVSLREQSFTASVLEATLREQSFTASVRECI